MDITIVEPQEERIVSFCMKKPWFVVLESVFHPSLTAGERMALICCFFAWSAKSGKNLLLCCRWDESCMGERVL